MDRVVSVDEVLVRHCPERTAFTRLLMPLWTAAEAKGSWRDYFRRYHQFTQIELKLGQR
ncbi:hypothetical protein LCGC14_0609380 [marine sediment metagenome]|uniref:Uncharacterized protein n=1 Tax=marine sediment metagenome TaxID=412755 RepID=A0A0F9UGI5_9ZZZZ